MVQTRVAAPIFLGSEIYRASSYGGWHPLRIPRVSTVMDLSRAMGWLGREQYRTSPRAKPAALHIWHTKAYIAALQEAEHTGVVSDATRARHDLGSIPTRSTPKCIAVPPPVRGDHCWQARCCAIPVWFITQRGARIMDCRTGPTGFAT